MKAFFKALIIIIIIIIKLSEKLVNFRMDSDKFNDLKMLALKERTPLKNLISGLIDDYVKKHQDGNPQFTIDQFKDPGFVACPAFFRDRLTWLVYYQKATPEELQKIKFQVIMHDKLLGKFL